MRKKRILWVNEASWKATGYSVYGKEVLSRLSQVPEFEVAELACYATAEDVKENACEWFVFPNNPGEDSEDYENYVHNPSLTFGEYTFNSVCLDFKPDIVMDIRDWWMFEYQQRSPFRDFFHWAIMPTVDAMPQNPQWINTFDSADSVLAYSEFGRDTMMSQCNTIPFVGVASPAASDSFHQIADKAAHRESMGMDPSSFIVGTVMRNQRRKLYPDLFKAFRAFLDKTQMTDAFLYCHTHYPDIGWEIPQLLDKFGLNNRVLFTYKCQGCGHVSPQFYQDAASYCPKCKKFKKGLVGIKNPIDEQELNKIYNLFDVYVQYANSEGFGMPQLEAAYAGVPLLGTNYSAMESVIKNIGAVGIEPLALSMECETGCYRAIPDNETFVDLLEIYANHRSALTMYGSGQRRLAQQNYNWDKTANVWIEHFKKIPMPDWSQTWRSAPQIKAPADGIPSNIVDITDKVNYIFNNVLHKPEWIGGYFWSKVVKDCTFGFRVKNEEDDYYFNESHRPSMHKYEPFCLVQAGAELKNMREQWNNWEQIRANRIQAESMNENSLHRPL